MTDRITRRSFVSNMASAAFGFTIVPRHVLGRGFQAPSDTVNVAIVGAGGMGMSNTQNVVDGKQNIVAIADVDFGVVDRALAGRMRNPTPQSTALSEAYRKAKRHADFRRMLDTERDIDAVLVATPDHTHAIVAKRAMEAGKHVYVQKPLTWSVREARVLADTARRTGVVTQMGNQGHSTEDSLRVNEIVAAGILGPIRDVHVWTNRPIWPQGVPRPDVLIGRPANVSWNAQGISQTLAGGIGGTFTTPPTLNWDLFLGPSKFIPYHPIYHPFNWRGWTDWGVGALGDMGAHLMDHPYMALGLTYPISIEATSTPWGGGSQAKDSYPQSMMVTYRFPARGQQPPVRMTWYDGGLLPPRPELIPYDIKLNRDASGGAILIGDRGVLLHGQWGKDPQLYPRTLHEQAMAVPKTLPRLNPTYTNNWHEMDWIDAIREKRQANSPFSYAAPLTEVMLLGLVALRAGQGVPVEYDGANMRVTNIPEANAFLTREARPGWDV
jgi:Oxidoreductase family, NAD-binding Rossmann fold/Oxidoreductase family, C-terminal alpha/beta domain